MGNSTPAAPKTPEPIVTKICMGDYVGDPTRMQNFITIRLPPFVPQMRENSHQVTRLVFLTKSARNESISVQHANEDLPASIAVLFLGDVVAKISVERLGARQRRLE